LDKPEVAQKKIMGAKTDSLNKVKFDFINQPGISNLMNIYAALTDTTTEKIEKQYVNKSYGEFKKDLAGLVSDFLIVFQKKHARAVSDYKNIAIQLDKHAKACQKIAEKKVMKIYQNVGLIK
jgi:tryptophanyl-tRNA synthetase